jgi:hypothetical protein
LKNEINQMKKRTAVNQVKKYTLLYLLALVCQSFIYSQGNTPVLNSQIVQYVNSVMGKKVDGGECWDLAKEALTKVNARWDKNEKYGRLVNPAKDTIYPGDLIQFENVSLSYSKDGKIYKEQMTHHTAIVYKVETTGVYKIAHQNTSQFGRKVGVSELNLADMTKGKARFYRPEPN